MAGEAASLPEETAPQATSIVDLGTMDVLTMDITEMVELSGIEDGKEVQRYLFILEGQKLVAPYPRGDFTSSKWQITEQGIRALRLIDETGVQPQGAAA